MWMCEECGFEVAENVEQCPKCGHNDLMEVDEMVNPMSRLPMEDLLKIVGHLVWLLGIAACIAFLWKTNTQDKAHNYMQMYIGFGLLVFSLIMSIAMFGLSEMLKRVIRMQTRIRKISRERSSRSKQT